MHFYGIIYISFEIFILNKNHFPLTSYSSNLHSPHFRPRRRRHPIDVAANRPKTHVNQRGHPTKPSPANVRTITGECPRRSWWRRRLDGDRLTLAGRRDQRAAHGERARRRPNAATKVGYMRDGDATVGGAWREGENTADV